jgi:hypothetical protein
MTIDGFGMTILALSALLLLLTVITYDRMMRDKDNRISFLLDELDEQQAVINELTDVIMGDKPAHPSLRLIKDSQA